MTPLTPTDVMCPIETMDYRVEARGPSCEYGFWKSGIVRSNPQFDAALPGRGKGSMISWPYLFEIDHDGEARSPLLGGTDCDCSGTDFCDLITVVRRRNKCWDWEHIMQNCMGDAGYDTLTSLLKQTTKFWMKDHQYDAQSMLLGIMEQNFANENDLIIDIGAGTDITNSTMLEVQRHFGCSKMFDGLLTSCENFWTFADPDIHVNPMAVERSQALDTLVGNFFSFKVIPDCNSMYHQYTGAATAGAARNITIAFCDGALQYGEGTHPEPVYDDSDNCKNNGDGGKSYGERTVYSISAGGYSWANPAGGLPSSHTHATNADLADPAHWVRQCSGDDVGKIPFRFILH